MHSSLTIDAEDEAPRIPPSSCCNTTIQILQSCFGILSPISRFLNAFAGKDPVEGSLQDLLTRILPKSSATEVGTILAWVYCSGSGLLSGMSEAKAISDLKVDATCGKVDASLNLRVLAAFFAMGNGLSTACGTYNGVSEMLGTVAGESLGLKTLSGIFAAIVFSSSSLFNQTKAVRYGAAPAVKLHESFNISLYMLSSILSMVTNGAFTVYQAVKIATGVGAGFGLALTNPLTLGLGITLLALSNSNLFLTQIPALKYKLFENEITKVIEALLTQITEAGGTLTDEDHELIHSTLAALQNLETAGVISHKPKKLLLSLVEAHSDTSASADGASAAADLEAPMLSALATDTDRMRTSSMPSSEDESAAADDPYEALQKVSEEIQKRLEELGAKTSGCIQCGMPSCKCGLWHTPTLSGLIETLLKKVVDTSLILGTFTTPAALITLTTVFLDLYDKLSGSEKPSLLSSSDQTAIAVFGLILGMLGTFMQAVYRRTDAHKQIESLVGWASEKTTCIGATAPHIDMPAEHDGYARMDDDGMPHEEKSCLAWFLPSRETASAATTPSAHPADDMV